jgi:hypothetical protein
LIESKRAVLNKFVISSKQNIDDNLGEKLICEYEIHQNNYKIMKILFMYLTLLLQIFIYNPNKMQLAKE